MFDDFDQVVIDNAAWDEPAAEINWDDSVLDDDITPASLMTSRLSNSTPDISLLTSSGSPSQLRSSVKPLSAGSIANVRIPSASSSQLSSSPSSGSPVSDLLRERHDLIESVATTCDLPQHLAQRMLDFCGWNVNTTVERFFNDRTGMFQQIGLHSTPSSSLGSSKPSATTPLNPKRKRRVKKIECAICFNDTTQYTQSEACGHTFCNQCWARHFEIQINDREDSISCMGLGCKNPIPDTFLNGILSAEFYQRYLDLMQKRFVQQSSDIRYCPSNECNQIVRNPILWKNCRTGTCSCGHSFCFDCHLPAHSPASCDMLKTWNLSEQWKSDQASTAWILRNTKDCPKCGVPIQKDRGCFLMVCRGMNCKHRFCWLCGGDWSTHPDHFACATFNEVGMSDQPEWRDRSTISESRVKRANEARYFTMYQEHDRASRFEAEAQKKIEEHLASLQDTSSTFYLYNVDFVREAYAVMFAVRYFLKHTYVFALYAPQSPESLVFQHQQSQLEMIAEKLSGLLEPPNELTSADQRQFDPEKVKSLTAVARTMLAKMAELDGSY